MAHTVFVDGVTTTANRIVAAWLNDADTITYVRFGNGTAYTGNLTVPGTTALTGTLTAAAINASGKLTVSSTSVTQNTKLVTTGTAGFNALTFEDANPSITDFGVVGATTTANKWFLGFGASPGALGSAVLTWDRLSAVTMAAAVSVGTTLSVTGTSTMAAINASGTVAMAGAATVGTTLGVTGATTLSSTLALGTSGMTVTGSAYAWGFGVAPSAWDSGKAIEVGTVGSAIWCDGVADMSVVSNLYYGAGRKFAGTGYAARYQQNAGTHTWFTSSASGTAGNTATMTTLMSISAAGAVTIPGTLGVTGAITGTTGTFTKAAAGDVLVLTNGGATPKPMYFYSDASTMSMGTSASQNGSLLGFVGTTSAQINISGGSVQSWTTAGTNVTGTLTVTNTVQPTIYLAKTNATATTWQIYNNGNLGFSDGTNTPLYFTGANSVFAGSLDVVSATGGQYLLVGATQSGASKSAYMQLYGTDSGSATKRWYVGINPFRTDGSYEVVTSAGTGVYIVPAATAWTATSDERLKDIIEPITDAVNKVSTLRAVIGKFKTDSEETRRSFLIAQDVQAVFPEAVEASDPDKLGVQYTDVIPLLVAAIKELAADFQSYKSSHP